jgi:hypothetical protein
MTRLGVAGTISHAIEQSGAAHLGNCSAPKVVVISRMGKSALPFVTVIERDRVEHRTQTRTGIMADPP